MGTHAGTAQTSHTLWQPRYAHDGGYFSWRMDLALPSPLVTGGCLLTSRTYPPTHTHTFVPPGFPGSPSEDVCPFTPLTALGPSSNLPCPKNLSMKRCSTLTHLTLQLLVGTPVESTIPTWPGTWIPSSWKTQLTGGAGTACPWPGQVTCQSLQTGPSGSLAPLHFCVTQVTCAQLLRNTDSVSVRHGQEGEACHLSYGPSRGRSLV